MIFRILDDRRKNISRDIKRCDLLSRQDVDNIKRSYNLNINEGVKHKQDAVSVDLWVEECKGLANNPVLYYKQQGQLSSQFTESDFILIIMNDVQASLLMKFGANVIAVDSTHGLNNYDFEMTTVMVIDEFNESFPVAFMFSNKKDTHVHKLFFLVIKQKVGVIKCKSFMSDITCVFYNAWSEVMGDAQHQLYCSWHIDRAWQSNLSKIIGKEKKEWVYKTLKLLQKHVEVSTFPNKLQIILQQLANDEDTKRFGEYFAKYYFSNCEKWAYCYRQNCGINTNMRLEGMHKAIKYFYLDGKRVRRLDKGLHATLKYVRDKIVGRLIKLTKGKHNINNHETIQRHRIAISSTFNMILETPGMWNLEHNAKQYTVKEHCDVSKCCNFTCTFCNICIHQYTCSCPDNFINKSICKHIHFVAINKTNSGTVESDSVIEKCEESVNTCVHFLSSCNPTIDQTKEKIMKKLSSLQAKLHDTDVHAIQANILSQILHHLNTAENLMDISQSTVLDNNFRDTNEISINKNIEPQKRFFSTQNKRRYDRTLKNPNIDECTEISRFLEGDSTIISKKANEDHRYASSSFNLP
ncbi:uncharacterized protein LOC126891116 [Diabrotica virgifera virgifera]|uniref:SWIM-type domain-containing protein n=1 Tax=Diabrotica virgifera virgifera TaxID=50390 RepID=A0ABM5L1E0_DIAVI|nr:uncharacterized protein LOC126891116 [Diabrotica virgifera virgifera]